MQIPTVTTPVARLVSLSLFTQGALRRYHALFGGPTELGERVDALAGELASRTEGLLEAQRAYESAVLATIAPRLEVKLVDFRADEEVRSVKRAAEEAGDDVAHAVFPAGITPIIRPVGRAEVDALTALEARIVAQARWPERETAARRIAAVRSIYEAALAARAAAGEAAARARYRRDDARADFLDVYASVAGSVGALFPRDRDRQDLFFDAVKPRSGGSEESEAAPAD